MALLYFNGFDLNYAVGPLGGFNTVGYWDFNGLLDWSALDFDYPMVSRIEGGQALVLGTQNGSFGAAGLRTTSAPSQNTARVGFEFLDEVTVGEKTLFDIEGTSRTIQITVSADNLLRAYDCDGGFGGFSSGTFLGILGSFSRIQYTRIEVYFQQSSGTVRIWVNGNLALDTVRPPFLPVGQVRWGWPNAGALTSGNIVFIDNVWCTNGEALVEGINGIQIEAGLDSYDSRLLAGFRGSMVFGDSQYQTDWQSNDVSSVDAPGNATILGKNVGNIQHFRYLTNPDTGEAWNESDLSTFRWGVCYAPETANTDVRLNGLALAVLVVEEGVPRIDYYRPGNVTYFSGPWRKNLTNLTYSANVNSLPRANVEEEADAPSLFINGPGCIFFDTVLEPPPEPPLTTIGITFAEEFRTDYRDWVRVTGTGFPFDSYFIAGYGIYGEGNRQFQNNYVTVNYRNVPTGGAYIQGLWDYSFDPDNGRWSMRQQVYHNSEGQTHGMRKLKIRGHGKALQIRVINDGDKPFDINGWSMLITSNVAV